MIITIDGPTASGKSTIGRMLARKLDAFYLCSGFLFRALAYVLKNYYGYTEKQFAQPRIEDIQAILDTGRLVYQYKNERVGVFFDDIDITSFLKHASVDRWSSLISLHTMVRRKIENLQHTIARGRDVVVDGRDAGSVVFPDAEYKFYITASLEERARRWQKQQGDTAQAMPFEAARAYIQERDDRDMQRKHSPLIVPVEAHVIDTTELTIDEVLERLLRIIRT